MQTFLPFKSPDKSATCLDNRRLGKQRVEALQIVDVILNNKKAWSNHPAVNMWRKNIGWLLLIYIPAIMDEWKRRGFKNTKCQRRWNRLYKKYKHINTDKPKWLNTKFCKSHQSNLIRKFKQHYRKYFKVKSNIKYIWPIKGEQNA